jgi:hypothetical protein
MRLITAYGVRNVRYKSLKATQICRSPFNTIEQEERAFSAIRPTMAPGACYACGTMRRWRSVYDAVVCAQCHPPADAALVAAWEGEEEQHL